ncbi:hypothetical protein N431DRAFT_29821 [Stipitochalara longipes BDJ]|nr:hypothetical protein N431DRAFT_29821 [Stipitochalara longipes BDJ]
MGCWRDLKVGEGLGAMSEASDRLSTLMPFAEAGKKPCSRETKRPCTFFGVVIIFPVRYLYSFPVFLASQKAFCIQRRKAISVKHHSVCHHLRAHAFIPSLHLLPKPVFPSHESLQAPFHQYFHQPIEYC